MDARRILIREAAGTVDGVRLGARPQTVIDRLGPPSASSDSERMLPARAPADTTIGPDPDDHELRAPGAPMLRYDDTIYLHLLGALLVLGPHFEGHRHRRGRHHLARREDRRFARRRRRSITACTAATSRRRRGPHSRPVLRQRGHRRALLMALGDPIDPIDMVLTTTWKLSRRQTSPCRHGGFSDAIGRPAKRPSDLAVARIAIESSAKPMSPTATTPTAAAHRIVRDLAEGAVEADLVFQVVVDGTLMSPSPIRPNDHAGGGARRRR